MIEPGKFYDELRANGVTYFSGVPDSLLKDFCAYVTDHVPAEDHVINTSEGSAVALAAGYHLATGRIPAVYLQNSGIGNAINPLLSLADPAVYGIPILFIIGWRGESGVTDEPQHIKQGAVMVDLLDAIGLPFDVIGADTTDYAEVVRRACDGLRASGRSHALLVKRGTFAEYTGRALPAADLPCTRAEVIDLLLSLLDPDDILVSTTGMTSREVFDHRQRHGGDEHADFLTVGSMGHCSQIALGIAQRRPARRVVCLDGDGAVLMHMGSLAIIGTQAPANFLHLVINNGAHDSVGGQPTAAGAIDIPSIAVACGYRHAESVSSPDQIRSAVAAARSRRGPVLIELRVRSQPETHAGRPSSSPAENKIRFMAAVAE